MTNPFDSTAPVFGEINGRIGWLLINRADKRNALNCAMWEAIIDVIDALEAEPDVSIIVIAGADKGHFSAGADIRELATFVEDTAARARNQQAIAKAQQRLAHSNRPTIAAIGGDCFGGGCGLAVHADLRVASKSARFAITPAKLGLVYPLSDQARLVDLIGPAHAKRLLFTGNPISADMAYGMGLVDVLGANIDSALTELVEPMLQRSDFSLHHLKQQFLAIEGGQKSEDARSEQTFRDAHDGEDMAEGLRAFAEKRAPNFRWRRTDD